MLIGVPKEIKTHEYRVGMLPAGVEELRRAGHTVLVEQGAGLGSGIVDQDYERAGATPVDQRETIWQRCELTSRPTTHAEPTYVVDGVVHYCVANIPGAVGRTSSYALCNATFPYALRLASQGLRGASRADPGFAASVNVYQGEITHQAVAQAFGLEYRPFIG